MIQRNRFPVWIAALALIAFGGLELLACTACFGQSDSPMAKGMNMGIFTLLLVITCVLGGVASFFVYLIRRSSQLAEAQQQQQLPADLSEHRTNA